MTRRIFTIITRRPLGASEGTIQLLLQQHRL